MIHLRSVELRRLGERIRPDYPFSVPAIAGLEEIEFTAPVTFLVGENGSGKSNSAQFIIATHSPILMAFPGATILNFDEIPVRPVAWGELEHVTITRSFLNDPGAYLQHL